MAAIFWIFLTLCGLTISPNGPGVAMALLMTVYASLLFRSGTRASDIHSPRRIAPWVLLVTAVFGLYRCTHRRFPVPKYPPVEVVKKASSVALTVDDVPLGISKADLDARLGASSGYQVRHFAMKNELSPHSLDQLLAALKASGLPTERITLESTYQPQAVTDPGEKPEVGLTLALDTFSSGGKVLIKDLPTPPDDEQISAIVKAHEKPFEARQVFILIHHSATSFSAVCVSDNPEKLWVYGQDTLVSFKNQQVGAVFGRVARLGSRVWIDAGSPLGEFHGPGSLSREDQTMKAILGDAAPDYRAVWNGLELGVHESEGKVDTVTLQR